MRVLLCVVLGLACLTSLGCVSEEAKKEYAEAQAKVEVALAQYKAILDEAKKLRDDYQAGTLAIDKAEFERIEARLEGMAKSAWQATQDARAEALEAWQKGSEESPWWQNAAYGLWTLIAFPVLRGLGVKGFASGTGKNWLNSTITPPSGG